MKQMPFPSDVAPCSLIVVHVPLQHVVVSRQHACTPPTVGGLHLTDDVQAGSGEGVGVGATPVLELLIHADVSYGVTYDCRGPKGPPGQLVIVEEDIDPLMPVGHATAGLATVPARQRLLAGTDVAEELDDVVAEELDPPFGTIDSSRLAQVLSSHTPDCVLT